VRDRVDELGPDTDVVLITFTTPDRLDSYLATNDLPFAVLLDPDRSSYLSYGLSRTSLLRAWGARAALRYIQLFARGKWRDIRRPTEDTLQLGGDFVVAPDGTLAYGFWSEGPDDRPAVDELIAAIS
jgi:peroxiredoxin